MANSAVHTGFWIDYSRSSSVLGMDKSCHEAIAD